MSVTPVDIRNKKFARGLSGYSPLSLIHILAVHMNEVDGMDKVSILAATDLA